MKPEVHTGCWKQLAVELSELLQKGHYLYSFVFIKEVITESLVTAIHSTLCTEKKHTKMFLTTASTKVIYIKFCILYPK